MHFQGLIIAAATFLVIGMFHVVVIKTEYHFGTRPWPIFLILGLLAIAAALFVEHVVVSSLLGVLGASLLWSIGELFKQRQRVERGWFPKKVARYAPMKKPQDIESEIEKIL